jgi:hypothetical protein
MTKTLLTSHHYPQKKELRMAINNVHELALGAWDFLSPMGLNYCIGDIKSNLLNIEYVIHEMQHVFLPKPCV